MKFLITILLVMPLLPDPPALAQEIPQSHIDAFEHMTGKKLDSKACDKKCMLERARAQTKNKKPMQTPPDIAAQEDINKGLLKQIEAKWIKYKDCPKMGKYFYKKYAVKQNVIELSELSDDELLRRYKALESELREALEIAEQCSKEGGK